LFGGSDARLSVSARRQIRHFMCLFELILNGRRSQDWQDVSGT
jgi:hypothetical protein